MFLDCITPKRLYSCCRGVAQLVAHRVWDAGVGGSSPPTPTGKPITTISKFDMKKKAADIIIEAARFKPNGQVDFVRAYQRRGATYSDCVLITRNELLEQLLTGKAVATGQRMHLMASTFKKITPVRVVPSAIRIIITSGNHGTAQDELPGTPIL
jgi:hypothetical protein